MHQTMTFVSLCVLHVFLLTKNVFRYSRKKKIMCCVYVPNFFAMNLFEQGSAAQQLAIHPPRILIQRALIHQIDFNNHLPFFLFTCANRVACSGETVLVLRPAATLNHPVLFGSCGTVVAFGPWNNCMHTGIPIPSATVHQLL